MMQVLAMHGWAGQAGTWSHWRQRCEAGGAKWSSADRGYNGGEAVAPAWPPGLGRNLLIAPSLGLHLLPAAVLAQADAVVLLGSFSAFVPQGRVGRAVASFGLPGLAGETQPWSVHPRPRPAARDGHATWASPPGTK